MPEREWFAAYLLYFLSASPTSADDLVRVQVDISLISAPDESLAKVQAADIGRYVGGVGVAMIESDAALRALYESGAHEMWEHKKMYEDFQFAGVHRIVRIGPLLEDGTLVDSWQVTADALPTIPAPENLLAFDPVGVAYTKERRTQVAEEWYQEYNWYLADQVFIESNQTTDHTYLRRTVLIKANRPSLALQQTEQNAISFCSTCFS